MKRTLIGVLAMALLSLTTGTAVWAMEQAPAAAEPQKKAETTPPSASPAAATIQGQVLKIESDSLIVSTGGGGQARLKLDGNTKIQGSPKVGDKVEAELSPERNVLSLKISQ